MRALLIGLLVNCAGLFAQPGNSAVPLFFIENHGQAPGAVRFMVKGSGITAYFSPSEVLYRAGGKSVRIEFPGAGYTIPEGAGELPGRANFFRGEPSEWVTGVPLFSGVVYRNLYPGIDLFYGAGGSNLKSQFEVSPGADPSAILMRYAEAASLSVSGSGELLIPLNGRTLREDAPVVYQESGGKRLPVEGRFVLAGAGTVRLEIGPYDHSLPLTVDPSLNYSTLIGGSSFDAATGLAVDSSGDAYITGYTSSYNFPTLSSEQNLNAGGNEVFVAKLNPAGNGLIYCTYIGGSGDDRGYGIAVDQAGSAYVTGSTTSYNFPTRYPIQSVIKGYKNAFVLKLSPAGNALAFSTYLGGSGSDTGYGIALDPAANAYVVGDTTSLNFPATGFQKGNQGGQDVFVTSINSSGSQLLYSTYLGGSGLDHGAAIAVDTGGGAYVTGSTYSTNFPVASAYQTTNAGGQSAFVARLAPGGSSLVFSTYLGGSPGPSGGLQAGQGIAVDGSGAYVAGVTSSATFPVLNAFEPSLAYAQDQDAFVAKLSSTGSLLYSTYLGGSSIDVGNAIAVDSAGRAYVAGYTASTDFPVQGGVQNTNGGGYDAFVAELSPAGNSLVWSTYLGGSASDTASAVVVDSGGSLYVAGSTASTNFPLANPYQSVNTDNAAAFVAKIVFPSAVPAVLGVTPSSGTGLTQTFSLQFSDISGAADLTSVSVLFNTTTALSSACVVTGVPSQNVLALLTDAGAAPGATITPGNGTQQNSQCILNGAASSFTLSGSTLTLNLSLTFLPAFVGAKTIYMMASNPAGSTGWLSKGSWTIQAGTLSAVSVIPSSGSGSSQTFTLQFSDTVGAADIASASILLNTNSSTATACAVTYIRAQNALALLTDSGAAPATPISPGSGSAQNSQCTLNGAASSVVTSGNLLTVTLTLAFQSAFQGAKTVYMQAANSSGSTAWQAAGTWSVQFGAGVVSVSPASGTGVSQVFALQYSDTGGAADLTSVSVLFSATTSTAGACAVTYVRALNTLALLTDSGAAPGTTIAPGTGTQQNSQCILNGAASSVTTSGNLLTLTVSLVFQPAFQGAKAVFMQAANPSGTTAWQAEGAWIVQFVAAAVSVNPASGSGPSQSYAFQFSDTGGAGNLTSASILVGTSVSTVGACSVTYVPSQNTLTLLTDTGSAPGTNITPGSGTQQNSQCILNGAASSVSAAGNVLTVNLALAFLGGFQGSKTIYMLAANASGSTGWQSKGTWTVQFGTIAAVSVNPASGSGASQSFAFQFSDSSGANDLTSVSILFNSSSSPVNGCLVTYVRAQNTLTLLTDSGGSPGTTITPGSGAQQNSQCVLSGSGSSVSTAGNLLTLTLALTFQAAFQGSKTIYMQAVNPGGSIPWQSEGSWTVQIPPASVVGVNPTSGSGSAQTFAFQFSDSLGASDLTSVSILFNSSSSTVSACSVTYVRAQNTLALLTDSGSSPGATITPGSGTQQNSQCILNGSGSSVSTAGNLLTLTLALAFQAAFQGSKTIYMQAVNPGGSTGWQSEGAWTVQYPTASAVSVSPASGTGFAQAFAFQFSDSLGASDLTSVSILFNSNSSTVSACSVTYVRALNTLALLTDAGSLPGTTVTPGSGTQQNSQCILNGSGSSVSTAGNLLTLTLSLTFQTAFQGSRNIYMQALNPGGSSGWLSEGAWTVQFPAAAPVSVSPASGSGASQTFAFQFSDPSGAADLTAVSVIVNSSASAAAACSVSYNQSQNTLALLTDSGAAPGTTIAPGSGTQQNSQCILNGAASSVSTAGNLLTLTLAIAFQAAFQGSKNVYMQAANPYGASSWQAEGSWTVPTGAPSAGSVTPSSGSGSSQTFAFQYSDTGGAADLTSVSALINTSASIINACAVTYNEAQNTLVLLTDAGAAPGTTLTPGTGSQQNSQCILYASGSSVSTSGNGLTLNLAITFQTAFQGPKNIYLQAADPFGSTGWQAEGTWTVKPALALPSGLVSYWNADGTPNDIVSGYNGVLQNGATYATGKANQAFSLNGANSYVQVTGAGTVTGARTYCAWVYPHAGSSATPVLAGGAAGGADFLSVVGSRLFVDHWGAPTYVSSLSVTPESWNHVAVTYDGASTIQFYVNGIAAKAIHGSLYNYSVSTLEIGGNTYGGSTTGPSFNGLIDEVQWYSRPLSASEISSIVNGGASAGAGPPTAVSVTPTSGSGASQTFSFQFFDPAGGADLTSVSVLVNSGVSTANACSVTYVPAQNALALLMDGGASPGTTITPGGGTQQNSQCVLNGAGSSVSVSGNVLILNLALVFEAGLSGARTVYMQASNPSGSTGWQSKGSWTVQFAAAVVSVNPASGSGSSQTFVLQFSDTGGAADLSSVSVLLNTSTATASACSVTYVRAQNTLALLTDSGAASGTTIAPGSGSLQNSQCILNGAMSSVSTSGNVLTLNVSLSFQVAFSGAKTVYLQAVNPSVATGWQSKGTWTVRFGVASVVSASPASGSGSAQTFSLQFSDTAGAADLTSVSILINSSTSTTGACSATYSPTLNTLALLTDSGGTPGATISPGGGTQQNSQCTLNGTGSSVSISGNVLTLSLSLAFQAAFGGAKTVYLAAANAAGSTGWQAQGTWIVQFAASPVSVSPASGSGLAQAFSFQFSDTGGSADLGTVSVLFNASASTTGACSVTYVRAQNTLALLTDAGAAPGTTITPGSGTAQNSQCVLSGAGSSASTSGNTLTLSLSITFQTAFQGVKTIYMQAADPYGTTAWQAEGTWTVAAILFPANLVSYWSGDGTPNDSVSSYNGILENGATYAAGKVNQAFSLNGTNSYVQVTGTGMVSGARTYCAWVNPHAGSSATPLLAGGAAGAADFLSVVGSRLFVDHWGAPTYVSSLSVTPESWNHVAVTYDGASTIQFYVNGVAAKAIRGILYNYSVSTLEIGGNTYGGSTTGPSFNGLIDEVQWYSRALTASEIQSLASGN